MKKIVILLISLFLLTACGEVDKDKLISHFKDEVDSAKAYTLSSTLEIYSAEDTFTYDISVYYMDDDYYKVDMVNKMSNHEQVILRNNDEVYVVTPNLNKSYKFVSEWPFNSSQSYILNTLVKDIESDSNLEFSEIEDGYSLKVSVNYPNNDNLKYEKINFDKDMNLKQVLVYDSEDIVAMKVDFNKIDYKANLSKSDFEVNKLIDENCCNDVTDSGTEDTASLNEIVYPLYVPANTYLKGKETINTDNGERVILTFNGDKNFVLIEEVSKISDEFEIIPVYGDPLMLNNAVGALSTNALSWTEDNVDYYLASNDLSTAEILSIAGSLNVEKIVEEK